MPKLDFSFPVLDVPVGKADMTAYADHLLVEYFAEDGPDAAVLVARGDEILFRGARGQAKSNSNSNSL